MKTEAELKKLAEYAAEFLGSQYWKAMKNIEVAFYEHSFLREHQFLFWERDDEFNHEEIKGQAENENEFITLWSAIEASGEK